MHTTVCCTSYCSHHYQVFIFLFLSHANAHTHTHTHVHAHTQTHTEPMEISLTLSSFPTISGQSVSLNCSVNLPDTEGPSLGDPMVQWVGPGAPPPPSPPSTAGQVTTSLLTLSAVRTSQAGQYTCTATLDGISVTTTGTLTVQSKWQQEWWQFDMYSSHSILDCCLGGYLLLLLSLFLTCFLFLSSFSLQVQPLL